jgi:hypothetical protein
MNCDDNSHIAISAQTMNNKFNKIDGMFDGDQEPVEANGNQVRMND